MKLNEFKRIEERWDFGNVNQYGNAQLQKLKNKFTGSPDAALSTRETRAKQIFVDKFVEKASAGLANAISTGAISTAPPAQQAQPDQKIEPTMEPQQPTQKPAPAQQKIDPAKAAELKGRLKGKAAPTSAPSGFKNYVGGSGERMTGVDQSGAPIFKKIQRESKYQILNNIFESILNEAAPSISSFVMDAFKAYAQGPGLSDATLMQQAQTLANEVQATYAKDKGVAALRKLGDLGYTVATASAPQQPTSQSTQAPTQAGQPTQPTQAQPAQNQEPQALTAPQAYNQVLAIMNKLDPKSQRKVIQALNQYVKMNQV